MAYANQTTKQTIAANIKPILAKYGVKASLSIRDHTSVVLTITAGKIDFFADLVTDRYSLLGVSTIDRDKLRERGHLQVNQYWYHEHYTGISKQFFAEIIPAMQSAGWYDRSDAQVDYFDTAYYYDINVGRWDRPYLLTK
jgi:hypothetical protein